MSGARVGVGPESSLALPKRWRGKTQGVISRPARRVRRAGAWRYSHPGSRTQGQVLHCCMAVARPKPRRIAGRALYVKSLVAAPRVSFEWGKGRCRARIKSCLAQTVERQNAGRDLAPGSARTLRRHVAMLAPLRAANKRHRTPSGVTRRSECERGGYPRIGILRFHPRSARRPCDELSRSDHP